MKKLLFSAFIAASFFSCKQETKSSFDLAKAKTEIEAVNKELMQYVANGDSVALAAAYTKDGALMINNTPSIKGTQNITSFWNAFYKMGVTNIKLTTLEVWGDENILAEEGLGEFSTKEGVQIDKAKYIVVWKKENGKWKLHRDISNSDLPVVNK
jgi:uncharacterized protein (TIGR02246 family)